MKIVYYYIAYIRNKQYPEDIEIHGLPFDTKKEAEEYQVEFDKKAGDRLYYSKIKRVDLSKFERGIWL